MKQIASRDMSEGRRFKQKSKSYHLHHIKQTAEFAQQAKRPDSASAHKETVEHPYAIKSSSNPSLNNGLIIRED